MEDTSLRGPDLLLAALVGSSLACVPLMARDGDTGTSRSEKLLTSSSAAYWRGDLGSAVSLAREAVREATAADNTGRQAQALLTLAGIHRWCAHEDSALTMANRGITLAHLAGDPCLQAEGLLLRCAIILARADAVAAELDSVRTTVASCGEPSADAHLILLEARLAIRAGDMHEARSLLSRQPAPALDGDLRAQVEQERLFLTVHVLGSEGRFEEAVAAAEEVLRADRGSDRRPAIADDLWALARLHLEAGDVRLARSSAQRALSVLEAMTPPEMTAKRRAILCDWLRELEATAE